MGGRRVPYPLEGEVLAIKLVRAVFLFIVHLCTLFQRPFTKRWTALGKYVLVGRASEEKISLG